MTRFSYLVRGASVAGALLLAILPLSTAQASVPAQASQVIVTTAGTAGTMTAKPDTPSSRAPDIYGCPAGDVCFFTGLDYTGTMCSYSGNARNLGTCTNRDLSVDNNGDPCAGCQDVNLYWGDSYTGAWFCLPRQFAKSDLRDYAFNRAGSDRRGLNEVVANNTASARWTAC